MSKLLSMDYIKYLNDSDAYGMTYDQWKNMRRNENPENCTRCGNGKDHSRICPKCKY